MDGDALIGRLLGGRFRVTRALSRGGMGAVYEASDDSEGGRLVAIKVVKRALADDDEAIARFKRETRLLREVKHDNVVSAIDAGDDDGMLWIAMELVSGISLRERLDGRGRWPWMETLPVVRQVALALAAVHDKNVIHRDLKPENIMLTDGDGEPRVKLVDFGVAKQHRAESDGATHMTGTGLIVGTPGYVAPELVIDGVTDDPRSDLYALGVTWFEMVTGAKPFSAKTPVALAMRHAHDTPPTPSSLLPFAPVPAPVEALIMRLMEKTPQARPDSAALLAQLVDQLADAAVAANTPMPSASTLTSLGADQKTMTGASDVGSTGVMPFSTPQRPAPSTPTTSTAPSTLGAATPMTAVAMPAAGSATPMTALAPTAATTSIALSKGTIALGIAAAVGLIVVSAVIGGVVLSRDARRGRSVTIEATNDGDSSALRLGSTSVDDSGPRHLGLAITSTSTTLTAPETPTPPAQPTTPEAPTLTPPETPTTLTPPETPETPETPTPTVQTTSPSGREERPPPAGQAAARGRGAGSPNRGRGPARYAHDRPRAAHRRMESLCGRDVRHRDPAQRPARRWRAQAGIHGARLRDHHPHRRDQRWR